MDVLEIEASVTERGQMTVPSAIRKALRVGTPGKVVLRLASDGVVTMQGGRSTADERDPAVAAFLEFLGRDIQHRPEAIQGVDAAWLADARALVEGMDVDLDAPLSPEDE